jgi:hypothetical protein
VPATSCGFGWRGGWSSLDGVVDESLLAALDELVDAFGDPSVRRGAVLVAAYTAASRAAWSRCTLTQPAPGEHLRRLVELRDVVLEAAT